MKSIQFSLSFSGNVIVELVHVVGRRGRLVMQASKPHPVRNVTRCYPGRFIGRRTRYGAKLYCRLLKFQINVLNSRLWMTGHGGHGGYYGGHAGNYGGHGGYNQRILRRWWTSPSSLSRNIPLIHNISSNWYLIFPKSQIWYIRC